MKLSEMAKKAKNKLIETFRGKREGEKVSEMTSMNAQTGQERLQEEKTDISVQGNEKGQEKANTEPTEGKEGNEKYVIGADLANGKDMTGYADINKAFPHDAQKAGEALKNVISAFENLGKAIGESAEEIKKAFRMERKTEAQIRKEELWKRYYEEKAKMSNNERRRRGIPMVRRPKRQQYRIRKQQASTGQQEAGKR